MPSWEFRIIVAILFYVRACEYLPQQLSVDRVERFVQIDEAHVRGDFPLSSESLQPAHDEQRVDRLSCGAEAALLLRD